MTPQLEEALRLLRLAERDRAVFEVITTAGDIVHFAAGFHAQQAVEKALKALLCARDIDFPRTHDLENLANRLAANGPALPVAVTSLRALTPYAVDFRYDDEPIYMLTEEDMRDIIRQVLACTAAELELLTRDTS
jgi:HEPN domain-containing protein